MSLGGCHISTYLFICYLLLSRTAGTVYHFPCISFMSRKQISGLTYLFPLLIARSDPLPLATSRPLFGLTSSAWTAVGCRKTHEIRLGGVKISALPTTSAVNIWDTPPVLEETSFPPPPHHSRRLRSRTLLSPPTSFRCTPPPERL